MRWLLLIASGCSAAGAMLDAGPDAPMMPFQDAAPDSAGPKTMGLHVAGNEIHDGNDNLVRLLGVNRSGSEYACAQGVGIFDGSVDDASIAAIKTWTANAVRIPLNEDCWLAINGVKTQYSGMAYKAAISDFVMRLLAQGIHPILELHWSAPGTQLASKQLAMPDRDHTPAFWSDVAKTFGSNEDIVFELFNEPFPDNNQDTEAAWTCWKSGGTCPGIAYQAAGMQELVDSVRQAGAHNLVLLGGVAYSNSLSGWAAHAPNDPDKNIAAAWHVYNFNSCNNTTCYDKYAGALTVPIVTTEIGEDDCSGQFIGPLMDWLDKRNQSYLGWVWNTWPGCLVLVKDYQGTPAGTYGQTFKTHIASVPH
jgi:aryl-phospho-beta-D-glucosidase BglC (GH1 family)